MFNTIGNSDLVLDIFKYLFLFGTLHSVITFGLLKTITGAIPKKDRKDEDGDDVADVLSGWIKIAITYASAALWFPVFGILGVGPIWAKAFLCLGTAIFSVALYNSAIKAVLEIIPVVFTVIKNKITGTPNIPPQLPPPK